MNGLQVIIRQTFYHGCYAMVGEDLYPNPDFWISALYKRLVSTKASHFSPSHSTVNIFKAKQGQKYQTKYYSGVSGEKKVPAWSVKPTFFSEYYPLHWSKIFDSQKFLRKFFTVEWMYTRTTDAQRRNSLHCMAENSIPIPNF